MNPGFFDNFLERINAVKDRQILLSLFNEFEKCLSEKILKEHEYCAIIKAFLRKISPTLFGQLTENEFYDTFGTLFRYKQFSAAIFQLLIHFLSEVEATDVYKFSKIVDLIDALQNDLIFDVISYYGRSSKDSLRQKMIDENFSRTVISFSDRVYNFFGSSSVNNTTVCAPVLRRFENKVLCSMKNFLAEANDSTNFNLCSQITLDYCITSKQFLESLMQWLLQHRSSLNFNPHCLLLSPLFSSYKQEQLIVQIISYLNNGFDIEKLFGSIVLENIAFKNILTRKLLINSANDVYSADLKNRNSRKIVHYLTIINASTLICKTFVELIQIIVDRAHFLDSVSFDQQFQLAASILDFAKVLTKDQLISIKHQISISLAGVVPEYLKLADNSRRQIGMFVTEFISNLLASNSKEEIHFDYKEDNVLSDLKAIANDSLTDGVEENIASMRIDSPVQKKVSKKSVKLSKMVDLRTRILDSDDDDNVDDDDDDEELKVQREDKIFEEELKEYETQLHKQIFYIRDCLETFYNEKENYKNVAMALRTLPNLIRQKSVGFHDIAMELVDQMICLEDRFKIPDFEELKKESLMLTMAYHPELVSHAVRVLFSNQCSMHSRYFILSAMECAAAFLSGEKIESKASKIEVLSEKDKKLALSGSLRDSKKLGKVIRPFRPKETQSAKQNPLFNVVPQFIFPLINMQNIGPHLDLYNKDHMLLGKILATIGQILLYAKNSPQMVRIINAIFNFLNLLRDNPHPFVLSGCIFCYSAIVDSLRVIDCFDAELKECFEWLMNFAETQQSKLEADPMLRNTVALTIFKLNHALYGNEEDS